MENDIKAGTIEAKDNLRWLSFLREPCEKLAGASPPEIPGILPTVLNFVRMIWSCSMHYKTENRISGLLKRISNEIIRRCQATIELQNIFEGKVDASMVQLREARDKARCSTLFALRYDLRGPCLSMPPASECITSIC